MRESIVKKAGGKEAYQPAGTTLDWTIDESAEMTATTDTINSSTVAWALEAAAVAAGWVLGAITTTTTRSSVFITAPAAPSSTPYRCTLTYQTLGGRTRVKAFWLYVIDPILFVQ